MPVPEPAAAPAPGGASTWRAAQVEAVVRRTPRAVSVFFANPLAPHIAGQHVDVRLVADDGYEARRSYSIASARGGSQIELLVERLADGEVSPFFNDVVAPGDSIEMRGPLGGHFVWRADQPGPLLLVAGGSGIAPLMAMLRERAATAPAVEALLLYSGRRWPELAYREELVAMAAADPRLCFVATTTRATPPRPGDFDRRVDGEMLAAVLARWARFPADAYVCGATGFVETATAALVAQGLPPRTIRAERYGGA